MTRTATEPATGAKLQIGVCCDLRDRIAPCLNRLQQCGLIDGVRLFLTPGSVVPASFGHLPVTCFAGELDWAARDLLMVSEMVMREPTAAAYLVLRGDALLGRPGFWQEWETSAQAVEKRCVLLFERQQEEAREAWNRVETPPKTPPRAVALSNEAARGFLADRGALEAAMGKGRTEHRFPGESLQHWAFHSKIPLHGPNQDLVWASDESSPAESEAAPVRVYGRELSIIVPTWNCGPYLRPCLRCLMRQTVEAEIIVVDDASDDGTAEILSEYNGRIRTFRHDRQRGANAARNTGLNSAIGDFVVMADADNEYAPDWLEKLLAAALSGPDVGVAYCGFSRLAEDGDNRVFASHPWTPAELWYNNYIDMPSLVRREALPEEGLDEGFRPYDDWRLWLGMATRGWRGKHVPENLYTKRIRKDSKTLRSKSVPADRARETALVRREFAHLVGLDQPIAVVIPAYGCDDLTVRCLNCLADFSGVPFVVYYVDNGSPISVLDTVGRAAEEHNVALRILRNSKNRGFTEAVNQGIEASGDANVLVLNNDCFLGPNCLEILAYEMATGQRVAAIGPVTCDRGGQSLRIPKRRRAADAPDEVLDVLSDPVAASALLPHRHKTDRRDVLAFFCTLLNREAIRRFGNLDTRFPSGLAADDEWCLRVRDRGWHTLLAYGAYAAHLHRSTFERLDIDRNALQRESQQLLRRILSEKKQ